MNSETRPGDPNLGREHQRYDNYCRQLFDLIDEIEDARIVDHVPTIPNVVAVGNQTSGKSSVLGKLSGVDLPVGDRQTTLCATQLALRASQRQFCCMEHPKMKEIANVSDVSEEISKIQEELASDNACGFNLDVMPRFRIENEKARTLTVVDLPGIILAVPTDQDASSIIGEVDNMVLDYIRPQTTIILCVINAAQDLALQKSIRLVRDVDPTGARTIVVFTNVDRLRDDRPRIRAIMDEIRGQHLHPYMHYVFVNTLMDTDDNEFAFFEALARDTAVPLENCTSKNLFNKVSYMLLKLVMEEFRTSWEAVDELHNRIIEEKNIIPVFTLDVKRVMEKEITHFIERSRHLLQGQGCGVYPGPYLFSKYRDCFKKFTEDYNSEMEKASALVVYGWRKLEPQKLINWKDFKCFARPVITSFQSPAESCGTTIRETNKELINDVIRDIFEGQKEFIDLLENKISDIFESQDSILADRLECLYQNESYMYTDAELFEKYLDRHLTSPQIQRARKVLHSFIKKDEQMATAMGILHYAIQDAGEEAEEVDFTTEELSEVLGCLGEILSSRGCDGNDESENRAEKTVSFSTGLKILRTMALDRISNTGCRKLSAKGVTKAAQQRLRHDDFLSTLTTGNVLRTENTRIMSDHHVLETVTTNKICLSAFDNKRFILPCGTKTLPFGHYETVDCGVDEIDWGNDDIQWDNDSYSNLLLSSSPEWDNDFVVSQTSSTAALSVPDSTTSSWETPDPGLVVTEQITESDIDTDDIADIDASSSESSSPDNPFINFEAEEASSSEEEPARKIRRR
ncbi:interferon-induced GTP-binding protein Mx-like isoform X2 [Convolutriloba macropyga]|uniref:interferon-induced GTP-binding protein Mx-like isoform X2 n=1 Tax=Convolutriloba macropyga TaxID=536237 RepID=UPI003F51AFEE